MKINIAIDGPSAAGKSTIAKMLASRLGYVHLDTGAMYRCTAYKALEEGISLDDENALAAMLAGADIELTPEGTVFLDGRDVTTAIRQEQVSMAASRVSRHARVRQDLVARQQKMAAAKGFIMDGRDIGTVVLKDAEVKVFLTASVRSRALRRLQQDYGDKGTDEQLALIEKDIEQRDYDDTHRSNSPLCRAEDAVVIDSSDMTREQVVDAILRLAQPYLQEDSCVQQ
ncbi:(d)CMP kinase [Galactobacillus timonensis]|uniref:(d)CMP kinase n=1 Tax=Galactobacillus timonensis TaxID=2041840 RepID=UPI000C855C79|nr:(d)CMP kinase [Galactobacillus timonensis]MDY5221828.1 (d)CMP kinase [Lachnospiraceae bacterium]MDY6281518.1 (d)CMP kinase [Erysipelotrichaceae bacterium]MCI6068431.1 (d)CMP kinase [Galactobacillus timonensis]MCI6753896.1 (d)CMP kinase [Galactobacillus timonensis]MDD5851703.1 (d)CMP kinase [Galactobacillus timonensis]